MQRSRFPTEKEKVPTKNKHKNNTTNTITSATDRNLSRNDDNILQQIDREK